MKIDPLKFPPQVSYWEIKQFLKDTDLLIIGSGIVGVSTAIHFRKANPNAVVTVVDRGFLPSGASTKNAGFACFGSVSEILSDLKTLSEEEVLTLMTKRIQGLNSLRKLLGDNQIEYDPCGGFEVFRKEEYALFEQCAEKMSFLNKQLYQNADLDDTFCIADNRIVDLGLAGVDHLILNRHEGSLDTGKMMKAMLELAHDLGILILNGLEVSSWTEGANWVDVNFKNELTLRTRKLHFATNGFAKLLLPELDVRPARAQVLVTSEVKDLKLKGTFHLDEGFYYFRNVGNRVLFGGGRNLDLETEETTELATTEKVQKRLDEILSTTILPNHPYTIVHRWAGIMGIGSTKQTIIRQLTDHTSCSVRLGGMGVAIGNLIGMESSQMLS
jgi:glycine/D-amino acid oxidase-like deaminating enzyme